MNVRGKLTADAFVLGIAALATLCDLGLSPGTLRTATALAAAVLVPGAAVATWFDAPTIEVGAALAVGLSVALETVVALLMLWTHWWHPEVAAGALLVASVVVLTVDGVRALQAGRQPRLDEGVAR